MGPNSTPHRLRPARVGGNSRGAAPRLYSLFTPPQQSYGMHTDLPRRKLFGPTYEYDGRKSYFPSPNQFLPLSRCRSRWQSQQQRQRRRQHGRRTHGAGQCRVFEDPPTFPPYRGTPYGVYQVEARGRAVQLQGHVVGHVVSQRISGTVQPLRLRSPDTPHNHNSSCLMMNSSRPVMFIMTNDEVVVRGIACPQRTLSEKVCTVPTVRLARRLRPLEGLKSSGVR